MYRLLTGAWPFNAATEAELYTAITGRTYEPLREAAPHVSRRLAERIERAMAYDETDRYQTWRDLHDAPGHPRLVPRSWEPVAPHPNHLYCWIEIESGTTHQVCAWDAGGRYEIETRRMTGAGSRVTAFCGTAQGKRALGVFLRRTFDGL
jgi:hypothetical protein